MNFYLRTTVRALMALALLWQTVGPGAAAMLGCCEQGMPCCVAASTQATCFSCVPVALPAPTALAVIVSNVRPAVMEPVAVAPPLAPINDIWRPPRPGWGLFVC